MHTFQAELPRHAGPIRALYAEYLAWANDNLDAAYGVQVDVDAKLDEDMQTIDKFLPPNGRLLLAEVDDQIVGIACLRRNSATVCEIKRMYVRPALRGQGIGAALLQGLLDEAQAAGYQIVRLDSAGFMHAAHALYRSFDFQPIAPYPESEIPPVLHDRFVFMERTLSG